MEAGTLPKNQDNVKDKDDLNVRQHQNRDNLKNEDDLKIDDDLEIRKEHDSHSLFFSKDGNKSIIICKWQTKNVFY